jgi:hypothetical protein
VVTIVLQSPSGPVGTDIGIYGNVPPQCQGSLTVSLTGVCGTPAVTLATWTAAQGEWGLPLVVPPVAAATVAATGTSVGPAASMVPGTYPLRAAPAAQAPGCAPATAAFTMTGPAPITTAFAATTPTAGGAATGWSAPTAASTPAATRRTTAPPTSPR